MQGFAGELQQRAVDLRGQSAAGEQVRRLVRTRLADYEQERASAPHRAARELAATFFDPQERASRPTGGAPDTVAGLTREDLVAFHAAHVGPAGATLVLAGDLTDCDLDTVLGETLVVDNADVL